VYAVSPQIVFSILSQFDSQSRDVGLNSRFRWTFSPGSDLFLVWNRDWEHPLGSRHWYDADPLADQLALKVRWTFRH
jgi:hypothetical protein